MIAIGIDIGGTKIALGLVDETGKVLAQTSLKTDPDKKPAQLIGEVADAVNAMLAERNVSPDEVKGIGVGAPGPLDAKHGRLDSPPNLPAWHGFGVVEELRKHFGAWPVHFQNDATAATLAEKWLGAAREAENFIFITVSTGIGAGIYMHGRLITGASGNAGDVGFITVEPGAAGTDGYWEQIASGTAIARQASETLGREVSTKEAFDLAAAGDAQMTELIELTYRRLGVGCVSLINTLDPELIVIGGGVSQIGDPLFDAIRGYVSQHALSPAGRRTAIVPAALSQNAGLIGAASLVHQAY
ncbi:ROK family protein [Saccharibacillus sp. CPCC 101409]|uniref:ROK family protein n=1 Tax=Saccharibacillus sp. CPCC 101409 TaxID=3058041 RepID=UPI002671E0BD|nr:ROK family protein [Saccharibacillus sp. CPCC 101409]MDO3411113.1 ROK family protein [Saccharibacillus sp. CPCC 101409]